MAPKRRASRIDGNEGHGTKKAKIDAPSNEKPAVCRLLNLPPELRNQIYEWVMKDEPQIWLTASRPRKPRYKAGLARTNRQIRQEFTSLVRVGATDIVAEVKNYDFGLLISWFNKLTEDDLCRLPTPMNVKFNGHQMIIKLSMTKKLFDTLDLSPSQWKKLERWANRLEDPGKVGTDVAVTYVFDSQHSSHGKWEAAERDLWLFRRLLGVYDNYGSSRKGAALAAMTSACHMPKSMADSAS